MQRRQQFAHLGADRRSHQALQQLRFPVGPARRVEPAEYGEPLSGIVGDDGGHLPWRDVGGEAQPPHFLDVAPHRREPLAGDLQARQRALDAIRLRADVDAPQFRRHAGGDRRKHRVGGAEQEWAEHATRCANSGSIVRRWIAWISGQRHHAAPLLPCPCRV